MTLVRKLNRQNFAVGYSPPVLFVLVYNWSAVRNLATKCTTTSLPKFAFLCIKLKLNTHTLKLFGIGYSKMITGWYVYMKLKLIIIRIVSIVFQNQYSEMVLRDL